MIARERSEAYLDVARRFLALNAAWEAVECATAVWRSGFLRHEAAKILAAADLAAKGAAPEPSLALEDLVRQKQKLDRPEAGDEVSLTDLARLSAEPSGDEGSGEPDAEGLEDRLEKLRRRLAEGRSAQARRLWARLEALAARVADGDMPEGPADDDRDHWDELSLEHEFHNLGNDFYKVGRFDQAVACYDTALDLRPDLLETYFNRGLAYTRKQNYDKALEDLNKVIELNENLAEAYYTRGLIYEYREEWDAAIADYNKALDVDHGYTKAETQRETAKRKKLGGDAGRTDDSSKKESEQTRDFSMYLERPRCTFADVGGNDEAKRELAIVAAFLKGHPALRKWGLAANPPRGVLIHGPPGCGKTLLARALAGTVGVPFYCVPATAFINCYYGVTEANIRNLWRQAGSHKSGAVIFIDEADALFSRRASLVQSQGDECHNRAVGALLACMDGLREREGPPLVVIAATNFLENVDHSFLRPGRFTEMVEVREPRTVRDMTAVWLIQLAALFRKAEEADGLAAPLREAVLAADRQAWIAAALAKGQAEPSGMVALAHEALGARLTGDDCREIVRKAFQARALAEIECGVDLGIVTGEDLAAGLRAYVAKRRSRQAEPGGRRGDRPASEEPPDAEGGRFRML